MWQPTSLTPNTPHQLAIAILTTLRMLPLIRTHNIAIVTSPLLAFLHWCLYFYWIHRSQMEATIRSITLLSIPPASRQKLMAA